MNTHAQGALAPFAFTYSAYTVRAVSDEQGNPWFCAKDVCDILGYANHNDAVKTHCQPKGVANSYPLETAGGIQYPVFLSEGNLYRLILKSSKPEAEPFEAWVCDEVLPAIRRQGFYGTPVKIDDQAKLETQLFKYLGKLDGCGCAFTKNLILQRVQVLCRQLHQPMPRLELVGKDPKQTALEGF